MLDSNVWFTWMHQDHTNDVCGKPDLVHSGNQSLASSYWLNLPKGSCSNRISKDCRGTDVGRSAPYVMCWEENTLELKGISEM